MWLSLFRLKKEGPPASEAGREEGDSDDNRQGMIEVMIGENEVASCFLKS